MPAIDAFLQEARTSQGPCLPNDSPDLTPQWHRNNTFRTNYARRHALASSRHGHESGGQPHQTTR